MENVRLFKNTCQKVFAIRGVRIPKMLTTTIRTTGRKSDIKKAEAIARKFGAKATVVTDKNVTLKHKKPGLVQAMEAAGLGYMID